MLFPRRSENRTHLFARGFTLIELLVVIAIIMTLISIAMPNYLDARLRANVAAALAEMRSMGDALEMYNMDYRSYPLSANTSASTRLDVLVEPVRFIDSLPRDKFAESGTYQYGSMDVDVADRWLLASLGPDRRKNTLPIEAYPGYEPLLFIGLYDDPETEEEDHFDYMVYSPTNGSRSTGDLYYASDGSPSL